MAETMTEDTVIVIHQIGSHGPSYWLRYPPEDEVFQPACQSAELTKCSTEEIVNAYDNTIRYTDQFLAQVIDLLDASGPGGRGDVLRLRPWRMPGRRRHLPARHADVHGAGIAVQGADGDLDRLTASGRVWGVTPGCLAAKARTAGQP